MRFIDYLASRPEATGPVGATDLVLVVQGGVLKRISPELTAVLTDVDGSDERFQVKARYTGLNDEEEKTSELILDPL